MQIPRKKILFVNRAAPHSTVHAQEALDALLMTSAFNQEISVLFMDDGVLQLKTDASQNNFTKTFKALSLYGIEKVYVAKTSLHNCNLIENDLMIATTLLTNEEVGTLMQTQDAILSF